MAKDLGWDESIRLFVDSSVAKAIVSRLGLGKVRHLDVRFLWMQGMVSRGRISLHKVAGEENPADLLTNDEGLMLRRRAAALGANRCPVFGTIQVALRHGSRRGRRISDTLTRTGAGRGSHRDP